MILDNFGFKGTFYISSVFFKEVDKDGIFNQIEFQNCIDQGHEIGCHTFSHLHFHDIYKKYLIEKDLERNNRELKSKGLGKPLNNFSYPFGEQTVLAKKIISKKFRSGRGTFPGINRNKVDLYSLKAIKLYESINSLQMIKASLYDLKKNGGWLIFYTHDVQVNPSKYGCTPEYFSSVVEMANEKAFEVLTVDESLNRFSF